jgi:hypothetical protein
MQPRKLLRRTNPKAGKKRVLLANNVTRKFGLFWRTASKTLQSWEICALDEMQPRASGAIGDYTPTVEFWKPLNP